MMLDSLQSEPILEKYYIGDPIHEHDGVSCCPAMKKDTDEKFIIKIISVPSSQVQAEALLLSGAFSSQEAVGDYFRDISNGIIDEIIVINKLSNFEGFLPFEDYSKSAMQDGIGYSIYLVSPYKRTLAKHFRKEPMTYLSAINLGLDMCSALSFCRKSGYMYLNLKPENIYLCGGKEFRIGDLGFLPTSSLRYTSLPDRYRSKYTAPEIPDAYAAISQNADVYSAGLVLYQAYNGGQLPFTGDCAPAEIFAPPAYADYEMAEIILKACAPDPAERWADPMEMGQALVNYMQRNGANDDPIIPPAVPREEAPSDIAAPEADTTQDTEPADDTEASDLPADTAEDSKVSEDISDITEEAENDTAEESENISYEEVNEDVSDLLTQVDDLVDHPVPDPVVAPEPVEIRLPEPEKEESQEAFNQADSQKEAPAQDTSEETQEKGKKERKHCRFKKHWLRNSILIALLLALIGAGTYYYINYFLQSVDSISVNGEMDTMTVSITSEADESLLHIVCSDFRGNQLIRPVQNGQAVFSELMPDTVYTIKVEIDGFHRLTGNTEAVYSTPIQTNIVQFTAVNGAESGTVILSFTIDGPDSKAWSIIYSGPDGMEQTVPVTSHLATIDGMELGKQYSFRLVAEEKLYISGNTEIQFTPSEPLLAQALRIVSCGGGKLIADWVCPAGKTVESWTARCYNDTCNQTQITEKPTVEFKNIEDGQSYTVEVVADGMSVSQRASVTDKSVTFSNILSETTAEGDLRISWRCDAKAPENGWKFTYTADGVSYHEPIYTKENSVIIPGIVPNAEYVITAQDASDATICGTPIYCRIDADEPFSCDYDGKKVNAEDITFSLCKTPSNSSWTRYDIGAGDYTSTFTVGGKASYVLSLTKSYGKSDDAVKTLFVFKDASGKIISASSVTRSWTKMWSKGYCTVDIPQLPAQEGKYTLETYFNSALVHSQSVTITA